MFEKCIPCKKIGHSCVPNLMLLSFPDLIQWCIKRQKFLGWTNQVLADKSKVPVGTINRIKAGEDDCKYSTMRSIIHALMGGYSVEFQCQKKLDQEFAHYETLEKQCAELISTNESLVSQMKTAEEQHRINEVNLKDVQKDLERALADNADAQKKIDFLKDLVAKLRTDNDNLWAENKRKSIIVDKYLESIKQ